MTPAALLRCPPVADLLQALGGAGEQFSSVRAPEFRGSGSRHEELTLAPDHELAPLLRRVLIVSRADECSGKAAAVVRRYARGSYRAPARGADEHWLVLDPTGTASVVASDHGGFVRLCSGWHRLRASAWRWVSPCLGGPSYIVSIAASEST
jgi:hypothetical protein